MHELYLRGFDLHHTLFGGQAFNWIKDGDWIYGVFEDSVWKIKYEKNILTVISSRQTNFHEIQTYFDYNTDYDSINKELRTYPEISGIVPKYLGLRILRQNFWQTLISFVISQNNNIPKIKLSIFKLSKFVNKVINFDGKTFFAFPSIHELAALSIDELASCSLGYRAKYIHEICQKIKEDPVLTELILSPQYSQKIEAPELKKKLLKLPGIGDKVADCILVYGYGVRNITPLDVWVKRALSDLNIDKKLKYRDIQHILSSRFGSKTAYIGQILFENAKALRIKNQ